LIGPKSTSQLQYEIAAGGVEIGEA
jgi:hypothetical protein